MYILESNKRLKSINIFTKSISLGTFHLIKLIKYQILKDRYYVHFILMSVYGDVWGWGGGGVLGNLKKKIGGGK